MADLMEDVLMSSPTPRVKRTSESLSNRSFLHVTGIRKIA